MTNASNTYVIFSLAGTTYAVPSTDVRHVDMLEHVTPLPNASPFIVGVVFSRGQVIPAMDLRSPFGFPREAPTASTRLVFVQVRERVVALIVDAAREFGKIPPEAIRPIEETLAGVAANYIQAVAQLGDRLILILDLNALLQVEPTSAPALAPPPRTAPDTNVTRMGPPTALSQNAQILSAYAKTQALS